MNNKNVVKGLLTVIVTIIDGGPVLRNFLKAIFSQEGGPQLEVIVPFDSSIEGERELQNEFPEANFLALGHIDTERLKTTAAGQHELYDRRRAAGLAEASGELIAILEDRGLPSPNWAQTVADLHRKSSCKVIGGAIECGPSNLLNWAFYVCDFGRYGLPFQTGPATWVSDINVTYKREAIEATRDLWTGRFSEPIVHWALLDQGETLILSSELIVEHSRPKTSLLHLLPERFHWGRLFGQIRAKNISLLRRVILTFLGPIIPVVLLFRHGRTQARKGQFWRYLRAVPYVAILSIAWTVGEVWGYVTKKA